MNRSTFLVVCTLVVVALTLAVRTVLRNGAESTGQPEASTAEMQGRAVVGKSPSRRVEPSQTPGKDPARTDELTVKAGAGTAGGAGGAESPHERAGRVEAHARARLAQLSEVLELSGAQERRIFPILARSAPDYDPTMMVGGAAGGPLPAVPGAGAIGVDGGTAARDESVAIYEELTPGQQAIYEDALMDDGLWWAEILTQIEAEYERSRPGGEAAEQEVMDDPGAEENLFDLLGQ